MTDRRRGDWIARCHPSECDCGGVRQSQEVASRLAIPRLEEGHGTMLKVCVDTP